MRIRHYLVLLLLLPAAAAAEPVTYLIDQDQSWIRVLVYRGGLLSRLGHNHIVSTQDIDGSIVTGAEDSVSVELLFDVAGLVVDDPRLRDKEGEDFPGHVPQKDIDGTRKNMLGSKLLDADEHLRIIVRTAEVIGTPDNLQVTADVTVRGVSGRISFPASAVIADQQVEVTGTANFTHEDIGLKPFSAVLGTLKVETDLTVRFRIVARAKKSD